MNSVAVNPPSAAERLAVARLEVASGVEPRLEGLGRRSRRALELARRVGAPVGDALAAAAAAEEDLDQRRRDLLVATAQARMVAGGLVLLPLVLVPGLDVVLGLPLLDFYSTGPGRVVAAIGLGLVVLGALASRLLIARVGRGGRQRPDDEVADLVAAALASGLPAPAALRAVAELRAGRADALHRAALCLEHHRRPPSDPAVGSAVALVWHAERLGAPVGPALAELARHQRAEERARIGARAERLPGQLTVPSVLLLLPATVLLVGAPVVSAGLAASP